MSCKLLMIFLLLAFFAKGQNKVGFETMIGTITKGKVDTLNSQKVSEWMQNKDVVLLDARESAEYQVSHLPGAIHIGYNALDTSIFERLNKQDTIIVYCSIGKRSEDITMRFKELGFQHVYNHFGGIFDWTNRGYAVVNSQNENVKCVHPYSDLWGYWVNNLEKCYEPR